MWDQSSTRSLVDWRNGLALHDSRKTRRRRLGRDALPRVLKDVGRRCPSGHVPQGPSPDLSPGTNAVDSAATCGSTRTSPSRLSRQFSRPSPDFSPGPIQKPEGQTPSGFPAQRNAPRRPATCTGTVERVLCRVKGAAVLAVGFVAKQSEAASAAAAPPLTRYWPSPHEPPNARRRPAMPRAGLKRWIPCSYVGSRETRSYRWRRR